MRKPIEEKGPLAAWATLARDEAGMSVEEVVDALGERGHAVTAATIRGIEGGSKGASVRLRRLLAEVYGTKPPGATSEAAPGDLLGRLDRLIAALELEQSQRVAFQQGLLSALQELARAANRQDGPAPELRVNAGR